jgi:beta-lactamase regulating signal transducer with metallopeptidase domain
MGVFGAVSIILCFFLYTRMFSTLALIWFILMIIVNLTLFGFGFYFLSVVLSSSDYTSTTQSVQSNINTLKNILITLLVLTGITLLTLVSGIIWYRYRSRISSLFSKEPSIEQWFSQDKKYQGQECKGWYDTYKKRIPILKKLFDTFNIDDLESEDFKGALKDFGGFTASEIQSLEENFGIMKKQPLEKRKIVRVE